MLFRSASGFCKSCDEKNAREAEEKRRKAAEEERQRKVEEERRRKEEAERQRKAEEELRRKEAEECRRREEAERQRKAEEELRKKEETKRQREKKIRERINGLWEMSNGISMQIIYPKRRSGLYEFAINYCGDNIYAGGYLDEGGFIQMHNETYTLIDNDVLIEVRDDTYGVTIYYRIDAAIRKNIRSKNLTSEKKARFILYGTRENAHAFEQFAIKSLLDSPAMGKMGLENTIKEYLYRNGMTREEVRSVDCSWMPSMFLQSDYDSTYVQLRRIRDRYQR